jgi:hypothetical protein
MNMCFASYSNVVDAITKHLECLQEASAPVTLVTVHGIVVATILKMAPEIFDKCAKDGSSFCCSDLFLCKWLHRTLLWSEWKATQVAQKLPDDWEQLCWCAFLCIAYGMKEEDIPAELFVNSDQTQVIYAQGSKLTWTKNEHLQWSCPSPIAVNSFHFKQSTKVTLPKPVHQLQQKTMMLRRQLAFVLSFQRQKLTGQHRRQCTHL